MKTTIITITSALLLACGQAQAAVAADEMQSPAVLTAQVVASIAREAQAAGDICDQEAEKPYLRRICAEIDKVQTPRDLYVLAVILNDGYGEHGKTRFWRIMGQAAARAVWTLARQGTDEAYFYFQRLRTTIGRDADGAFIHNIEARYFPNKAE